jgi:hypothetical protein
VEDELEIEDLDNSEGEDTPPGSMDLDARNSITASDQDFKNEDLSSSDSDDEEQTDSGTGSTIRASTVRMRKASSQVGGSDLSSWPQVPIIFRRKRLGGKRGRGS